MATASAYGFWGSAVKTWAWKKTRSPEGSWACSEELVGRSRNAATNGSAENFRTCLTRSPFLKACIVQDETQTIHKFCGREPADSGRARWHSGVPIRLLGPLSFAPSTSSGQAFAGQPRRLSPPV